MNAGQIIGTMHGQQLGRLGALPGMTPVLEVFYKGFLRIRPRIQRLVRGLDGSPPPKP
jgi:hypothetical protein